MSNNSIGSILQKGSASDYISIKKQTTLIKPLKNKSNNFLFNNSTPSCNNYLRSARSYELLNNYKTGQQICYDISFNNTLGLN
jgi:hypothetical protein